MATSGTYTFAPNRAALKKDVAEIVFTDRNAALDSTLSESIESSLNALIKSLNVNKTDINVIIRTNLITVAGQAAYDLSTEVIGIDGALVSVGANDYLIRPLTKAQYDSRINKASTGRPEYFYHDKQAKKLYLVNTPDAIYTVTYGLIRMYQDMTDDDQTFDFPVSAIRMLTYGTAYDMAVKAKREDSLIMILDNEFKRLEREYLVANSGYTKGQVSSSVMVV